MKYFFLLAAALPLVSLCACKKNAISSVEREDLFSLDAGPMEDQIALYLLEGDSGVRRTSFTMRDGLFYITDGNSAKIVRYNSYGDLLFMIYNEEANPAPISLKINIAPEEQATRWAFSHPLREPGWITVDSRKHIFVEDRLPPPYRLDPESDAQLDGIILHFDQNGRFIDYLGREGIGGSPFPRIVGLCSSTGDELAVICRIPGGWNVYWYNASGVLLYLVKISSGTIPAMPDMASAFSSVDRITAAPDSRKIFLKADYYRDTFDQSTKIRTGSEPAGSVIWTLDIETGIYDGSAEIPPYEVFENGRQSKISMLYSMLGMMRGGKALFYSPVDTGYSILFLDIITREQRRGYVNFSGDEIRFSDFYLSPEGILSAMLVDNFKINMVWWRTDRFIGEAP
ncbi:MAG: hypothetical protein LBH44_06910 [Treponema sp.]|jgi:hypothetical protein|nr:hypothetical protein [Treponema sp.]